MTRRLIAAALLTSSLGGIAVLTTTAHAAPSPDSWICIGSDDGHTAGRMVGYCIKNPLDIQQ